jgi:hypothetical protein
MQLSHKVALTSLFRLLWNFTFQEATDIRLKEFASNSRLAFTAGSGTLRCDSVV